MFSERETVGWVGEEPHFLKTGVSFPYRLPLGWQRVIVTFTALALAAEYKGGGQEQKGRSHQEQEPKSSKDAHDLCPMPDHRSPGVAQLVAAGSLIVVDQEEVVVQGLQAVPAEGVLAVLAHHLRAALVPLDVDSALGAALDGRRVIVQLEPSAGLPREEANGHALRAALARMPASLAGRAELHIAGLALHQLRRLQPQVLKLAHSLAGGRRAPGPAGIEEHLSFKLELFVSLHYFSCDHAFDLLLLQVTLLGAGRIRAADRSLKSFLDQELHVLLQAQGTEDALALGDGGHLLHWVLPEAQLAGHERVEGQVPGGPVPCCGHRRAV